MSDGGPTYPVTGRVPQPPTVTAPPDLTIALRDTADLYTIASKLHSRPRSRSVHCRAELSGLALGLAACQKGFPVAFTTAAALVTQLMEARDERRLLRMQRELQAVKLLIVDELGYVPLSPTGAELLFETVSQRYERGSTIITSNLPFEDWTSVLGSARLTGALLDRLTHHVTILAMNGDSYRLKQSTGRRRTTIRAEQNQATPETVDPDTGEITIG